MRIVRLGWVRRMPIRWLDGGPRRAREFCGSDVDRINQFRTGCEEMDMRRYVSVIQSSEVRQHDGSRRMHAA